LGGEKGTSLESLFVVLSNREEKIENTAPGGDDDSYGGSQEEPEDLSSYVKRSKTRVGIVFANNLCDFFSATFSSFLLCGANVGNKRSQANISNEAIQSQEEEKGKEKVSSKSKKLKVDNN
jgi:hypothetical protein